jgi:hypothetical protein
MSKWGIKEKETPKPTNKEDAFAIMLPKESNEILKMREFYGLCNARIFE